MQISVTEARKVARVLREQAVSMTPIESVPAPFVANAEADQQLAKDLARELAAQPDIRHERVQEVQRSLRHAVVDAKTIAGAMVRRALADKLSQ